MRNKVLLLALIVTGFWFIYSGFSSNDDSPRWNPDPRTRINSGEVIQDYAILPQVDYTGPVVNEPVYYNTQMGVFVVNSPFRVHPITAGHQTETPITRHPTNPLIMFGSANTSRGGNFSTGWYVTTDGGTTWTGNDTLFNSSGSAIFNFGDPGPAIDRNGRFINSFIMTTGRMGASYSTNNGVNWATPVTFTGSTTSSDKNFSSTDDAPSSAYYGRSYTFYTEFSGTYINRIVGTYTTDGGVTWSAIAPVSPPAVSGSGYFHQGVDTKCGPNGEVYAVWTCAPTVSPYTEDSLGFAKSTNGGVSWVIAKNNAANVNGNRTFNMMNGIRVAGFPRIDVDRTNGPRAGWIYVTVGEKNPGVAGDVSDIVLYKSTDGGNTFSSGVRVNQDAFGNGRKQYMAAVRVDESGGVNVVYYDTRNTPTGDSSEVYLSRSTDGGVTFTDIKVGTKFKHAPTGVSGVNTQYAGDYIGVTSALIEGNPVNGNQRIWPYWMSNLSGVYNAWTAKVELTPRNPVPGCQDFSSTAFTPDFYFLEYTGTQFFTRQTPSAYGIGTGSVKYDFYNDNFYNTQSLITDFEPVGSGYYLTFDNAYAPFGPGYGPDTLIVQSSTNGGVSYSTLSVMLGKADGTGELNTAPATTGAYSPTNSQWRPKIFALPAGTNRIRLRAESGFGNNLYLDNICVQSLPNSVPNTIGIVSDGLWNYPGPPYNNYNDTFTVYLHRTDYPNVVVDSGKGTIDNNDVLTFPVGRAINGNYYRVVKHRNSITTWSNSGFNYTRGGNNHWNFLYPANQSYGNNMRLVVPGVPYYAIFSGDIDRDETIDASDLSLVENAAVFSLSGYINEDVNGDFYIDASDIAIVENNLGESVVAPPGAEPQPEFNESAQTPVFENDLQRQKYEKGRQANEEMLKQNKLRYEEKIRRIEELKQKYNIEQRHKDWEEIMNKSIVKTDISRIAGQF